MEIATESKITALANALVMANKKALLNKDMEDGGTCNFDQCMINLKGWKKEDIEQVAKESGITISEPFSGRMWKGWRPVGTALHGQGARRSKMAEVAHRSLKEAGFDVTMYYAMD